MSKLMSNLPSHNMYVELFSGNKTMLFKKLPNTSEVYNDNNNDIGDFFEVIRRDDKRFIDFLNTGNKPEDGVKVEKWDRLSNLYRNFTTDMLKGNLSRISGYREISKSIEKSLNDLDPNLGYVISRLRMLQYENRRFDDIIDRFDNERTVFYIDVTNLPEDVSEKELAFHLLEIKGKGILHGADPSKFAQLIDEGWKPLNEQDGVWINFNY